MLYGLENYTLQKRIHTQLHAKGNMNSETQQLISITFIIIFFSKKSRLEKKK